MFTYMYVCNFTHLTDVLLHEMLVSIQKNGWKGSLVQLIFSYLYSKAEYGFANDSLPLPLNWLISSFLV